MDLPDLAAAREAAVEGIRSILRDEVAHGMIDFEGRVEIEEEGGGVVLVVSYAEAVEMRPEKDSE